MRERLETRMMELMDALHLSDRHEKMAVADAMTELVETACEQWDTSEELTVAKVEGLEDMGALLHSIEAQMQSYFERSLPAARKVSKGKVKKSTKTSRRASAKK